MSFSFGETDVNPILYWLVKFKGEFHSGVFFC